MDNLRTYLLCLMICGLLPQVSLGQSNDVVVLKATVAQNKKDKAQVDALNKLAVIESGRKPKQAFDYAQKAEKIANAINYKWGYAMANQTMGDLQVRNNRFLRAVRYHEEAFNTMEALLKAQKISQQKLVHFISKSLLPAYRLLKSKKSPVRRERRAIRRYQKLYGQAGPYHSEHAKIVKEELRKKKEELRKKEEAIRAKDKTISDKDRAISTKNSELEGKASALKRTKYQKYLLSQQKLILSLEKDSLSSQTDTLTRNLRIKEMKEKALMDSLILQDLEKKGLALKAAQHKAEQEKLMAENKQKKLIINFAIGGAIVVIFSMIFIIRSYLAQKKANKLLALQKEALAERTDKIVKQKEALSKKNEEITKQKDELATMNEEVQQRNEEINTQMELIETQNETIKQEQQISDALLLNILPEEVANELKEHGKAKIRHHEMVSVLFTDFKGFTKLAETMPPQELVQELEKCFTLFDEIMEKHNLEKIKTIGDAYMAVGGLPVPNTTNFVDIVLAGLEIQRSMDELKAEKEANGEPFWETRLGINTGKLIAGVIGKNKFAYDVWGDTVNTASRMESSGEIGRVNISGVTYELVKDFFECEYRGKIMAKNKGAIDMYFVNSIKAELSISGEGVEPNERFKAMLEEKSKEVASNPTMAA
ncbi:adenylate/guanylate cyclase domain-containing protein [uncultured Microscilla sp.]|uniref:adenylate/guanylate cyclase domain-containing protein n=1 Tax=uncultured Microscilla sp. TaxID=432653 RepID=UPI00263634CC|nr:adenylate/guanylate cyclase domain-containing protein [uncultured Microscilla sp.]